MSLTVRRLQITDLPALEKAGRAGTLAGFRKLVEQTLSKEPEGLMIADLDGTVVGAAIARQRGAHPGSGKKHGRVEHLGVAPGFESQGIAARLLREAEAYLRSRGCETIQLRLPADDAGDAQLLKEAGYRVVAWELEKAFR